jgi:hypothetical protein
MEQIAQFWPRNRPPDGTFGVMTESQPTHIEQMFDFWYNRDTKEFADFSVSASSITLDP